MPNKFSHEFVRVKFDLICLVLLTVFLVLAKQYDLAKIAMGGVLILIQSQRFNFFPKQEKEANNAPTVVSDISDKKGV